MNERLDLPAIEDALVSLQRRPASVDDQLTSQPAAFSDIELENLLLGYRLVDAYLAAGVDLFVLGNSRHILELNNLVLFGEDARRRERYRARLESSEEHFYQNDGGGIGDLVEFYQHKRSSDAWHRAAMVYVRMHAQPQLFVEGNHRTGALLMSHILVRAGLPPFVLRAEFVGDFFNPSAKIGGLRKRGPAMWIHGRKLYAHFVKLLKAQADPIFLAPGAEAQTLPEKRYDTA